VVRLCSIQNDLKLLHGVTNPLSKEELRTKRPPVRPTIRVSKGGGKGRSRGHGSPGRGKEPSIPRRVERSSHRGRGREGGADAEGQKRDLPRPFHLEEGGKGQPRERNTKQQGILIEKRRRTAKHSSRGDATLRGGKQIGEKKGKRGFIPLSAAVQETRGRHRRRRH